MSSYLQLKKRAFMSIVNGVKGFVRTVSGVTPISLEDCVDSDSLIDYKLYGNSFQDGTPSPENSIPVVSVGEYDGETGKYKIPVTARGKNLLPNANWLSGIFSAGFNETPNVDYITEYTQNSISFNLTAWKGVSSPRFPKYSIKKIVFKINQNQINSDKYINFYINIQGYDDENNNVGNQLIYSNAVADTEYVIDISTLKAYAFFKNSTQLSFCILNRANAIDNLKVYDIAYYSDTDTTDYEPYHEPIQTNIYLDEPLRKVGDYADYVDFGKGEVVRKVKEVEFSGSENWYNYPNGKGFHPGGLQTMKIQTSGKGLCNCFTAINNINLVGIRYGANNNIMYFCQVYTDENPLTVNGWKTKLTELKEAGTPVKVTYILAEETHTPISIPKLPTIKGTTIYEIGTSLNASNMEATYYSTVKGE